MLDHLLAQRCAPAVIGLAMLTGMGAALADDLPSYMKPIAGPTSASAEQIATANVAAIIT